MSDRASAEDTAATASDLDRLDAAVDAAARTALALEFIQTCEGAVRLGGAEDRRADLSGVSLPGARLRGADLAFADLQDANLSEAFLARANLAGAVLHGANLQGADLSHAAFTGAQMSEIDLKDALMEDAMLDGASLRFSDLRNCVLEGCNLVNADLWGAKLAAADFSDANLRRAIVGEAFAEDADFSRADLRDASLANSMLRKARFEEAQLAGVSFKGADLSGASFAKANLQGVDLTSCILTGACWDGAKLDRTMLNESQLGGAAGEERLGDYAAAAGAYVVLERNFASLGDVDASSWAYRRKRRMQKRLARIRAVEAWRERRLRALLEQGFRYLGDEAVEWTCDYGESIGRVIAALAVVYVGFMLIYGLTGSVLHVDGGAHRVTRAPDDLAIYSLMAMTTSGSPSVDLLPSGRLALLLSGLQAFIGIFLTGLLGFVAGNRIRR